MVARTLSIAHAVRGWTQRHRTVLLTLAFAGFMAGTIVSLTQLDFDPARTRPGPLALLALVLVPITLLYSAINLQVMAQATGTKIALIPALRTSVIAGLAELLPIPGGAIVRTAALTKAGAKVTSSVELVLAFALLWIAVSATGGAMAMWHTGAPAIATALASAGASAMLTLWIARRYGWRTAVLALVLRVLGLLLTVLRVGLALMALAVAFQWSDTFAFGFAIVAGTASAIIPAGLGLSEGLSALLASALATSPAGAFLAVALNRIVGLIVNWLAATIFSLFALAHRDEGASADA